MRSDMNDDSNDGGRIIVALDFPTAETALALVDRLDPGQCRLKVGKELFTSAGPDLVRELVARGFKVFLDLKFHDIPNTVARACAAAAELGVWMMNVHAQGGRRMMQAARESLASVEPRPRLIAVTLLTSLDATDLGEIGYTGTTEEVAARLAGLAQQAGLDGVVCSAQEASAFRRSFGSEFVLVTPGIRPADADGDDQRRVMTPTAAIQAGADFLVIGRPITAAADPVAALAAINREIDGALSV